MTKIYFILIFLISFVTVYAQNESDSAQVTAQTEMPQSAAVQTFPTKTEADSAYIRNDFAASVEMYENILKNEGESSDIYYNLGNSYYKMNNIAKAVLNYERALLLNPGNSDIRFNLELARSKTVDKVIPSSKMFFVTWTQSLILARRTGGGLRHHEVLQGRSEIRLQESDLVQPRVYAAEERRGDRRPLRTHRGQQWRRYDHGSCAPGGPHDEGPCRFRP